MKTLCYLILICWFANLLPVCAQSDVSFRFHHFNIENGLSSNSVNAILQDHKGYIWIGGNGGLDKFDGKRFVCYQKKGKDYHGLGDNGITALYESTDKKIWVGTENGLYIYDPQTDRFHKFSSKTPKQIQITSLIGNILQDKKGIFWITTRGQGVFAYHPEAKLLKQYEILYSEGNAYMALSDQSDNIWMTGKNGVYILNRESDSFEPYLPDGNNLSGIALLEDKSGNIWFGTWDQGLMKIDRTGKNAPVFYPQPSSAISHIHSIIEYEPGILLIGSDCGLTQFNALTGTYKHYENDERIPTSLSNRFVYPLLKDREGGLWIGTYYGGVNYASPYSRQFEGYVNQNLQSGKIISKFCEESNGNIYIGSDDGGISCFSPGKCRFIDFPGREKTSGYNVHALLMNDHQLWIGTYSAGLNILDTRTGEIRKHGGLSDNDIYALHKDRKNRIWLGSTRNLFLYESEVDSFRLVRRLDGFIYHIDEDDGGKLWIATMGKGLFKYYPEKNIWKHYGVREGLPCEMISFVLSDEGKIWVSTGEGLYLYQPDEDCFKHIPLDIPSESINCIIEGDGCLWLTTDKGLVQYSPRDNKIRVFTVSDGLQSETFVVASGMRSENGELFVGTTNGFNAFYPHRIYRNERKPTVVLTGLEIFNKEVPVEENGILSSAIDRLEEIHLSYEDNMVSILYAALSYCAPAKNQYAYKLEGFNKDWIYTDSREKATYTNLPAGEYLFRVKASNNDGIWNDEGASIRIIVHPPFYRTVPFKILYFLLLCLALGLLMRFLLHRNERKHLKEIERMNTEKEKEVHEAKIKFFTMIAHEIRTPVSLIIGPLESVMEQSSSLPEVLRENLNIINRNGQRLLYLVNQLLDFRKVEEKKMKMNFCLLNVKELLQSVCERFRLSMEQNGITLYVEYPEDNLMAMLDREAVTKLVSNLLTNALKYTKDRVELTCHATPSQHTFTIRITDNGAGISKEEQKKIFKPFYQTAENKPGTGIGLSIVKGIVEAHKGCIAVESEKEKGASFIVILPLEQIDMPLQEEHATLPERITLDNMLSEEPASPGTVLPVMLIVDDNEEMLQFLSSHFKKMYDIVTANDGTKALEILKKQEVALVVSDWMMPHMNGVELCKAMRENQFCSHIPFILLTAKTDMASKVEGMDCGADLYMEKPFSMQYLEACIKNLIEQRELLRKRFSQMPMVPLNSVANNTVDKKFLAHMNEIIEENVSNPELSVDFLAKQLGISRSGLFTKIRTLVNVTPNELIQVIRLKKAASLLAEQQYRINEVSYMVGFSDPTYFSKCFLKQFGMKPKDFMSRGMKDKPENRPNL